MFIGGSKKAVVDNIARAAESGQFYNKVELDDPDLTEEEKSALIEKFLKKHKTPAYAFSNWGARCITDTVSRIENQNTEYVGLEHIRNITTGAIVTSNHFNPLDNTVVREALKKVGKKRMYIVSEETNFAMKGLVGYLMNYMDTIPIWRTNQHYMGGEFVDMIRELMEKKQMLLIYQEQEMWFNYRNPRPPKRGAYYYAAQFGVPVISCFVELRDLPERENGEFLKTRAMVHILPTIYPDPALSPRENSFRMMEQDMDQKREAYEKAYGKPLTYDFDLSDIAGWRPEA